MRWYHNTHHTAEQLSVKYLVIFRVAEQIITIVVFFFLITKSITEVFQAELQWELSSNQQVHVYEKNFLSTKMKLK